MIYLTIDYMQCYKVILLVLLLIIFVSVLNLPPYSTLPLKSNLSLTFKSPTFVLRPDDLFLIAIMMYLQQFTGGSNNLFSNDFFLEEQYQRTPCLTSNQH
jgi:hypothetical protein